MNQTGPPWLLIDRQEEQLVRIFRIPGIDKLRIATITAQEDGRVPAIYDAIPWTKEKLLLATDRGLRTFEIASDKVAQPALPDPKRLARRLCRDGRGRLWIGGEGLVMIDTGGRTIHTFDALPMLGRSTIDTLAADPGHADGVVAALSERGLLFVQARPSR